MERIKVPLPDKYTFSTIITIRITDLNYGGHVGNDVFLSLILEARLQFLHHYDYSELVYNCKYKLYKNKRVALFHVKKELLLYNS